MKYILILLLLPIITNSQASVDSAGNIIGYAKSNNPVFTGQVTMPPTVVTTSATGPTVASTGTVTVSMTNPIITCTPTGAMTLNATGGIAGQRMTFIFTTSGVTSFVITFGTNFKSTGTLATGTTTAKIFPVSFLCTNGTQWLETSRTIAQ